MQLKQYYLGCLAHASYMIADEKTKQAAIVDPQRDIEQYLADAKAGGLTITHVFLTHLHADFLAGHIELRNRTGAKIYVGVKAPVEYDVVRLSDGDIVEFGDVRLKIMETPGHTPESISILVHDLAKDADHPLAVLTGDVLFIGDVGRPDLLASIGFTADQLGDKLYDSINRLKELPDSTLLYPAHGAGSLCGKSLSKETVSTIGDQKRFNYALQPMSREEFKRIVTADQPDAPSYFVFDAIRNRQDRPDLDAVLQESLVPLTVDDVVRLRNQGAQIVDVRDAAEFEPMHLVGSINVGLSGKYATWCGTVLEPKQQIVVIAQPGKESEAVMRLGRIGYDNVVGFLEGGVASLKGRPDLVRKIDRVTTEQLSEKLTKSDPPAILDVRTEKEWQEGHVAGSVNVPLNHLQKRIADVRKGKPLVVHCEGGYRSAIACSILEQAGRSDISDLVGGYKAWATANQSVES